MGYDNLYYDPQKFDLTLIDEIELGGAYEFDTHVVYKHKDGRILYIHDCGCSCPTPFEGQDLSDMELVTKEAFGSFKDMILSLSCPLSEKLNFISKVESHLKA